MTRQSSFVRLSGPALAAALGLSPLAASAQTVELREELDTLAATLDRAARRVSRPARPGLLPPLARGYQLPGLGVVFVLAPRALPAGGAPRAASDLSAERALSVQEAFHERAEIFRREAERAREQAEREVRLALGAMMPVPPPPPAPEPPGLSGPPWGPWLQGEEELDGEPDDLVRKVQEALLEAVEAQASRFQRVAGDVVVAVDFVPPGVRRLLVRPRTLVLRVRRQDLADRRAGRLPAAEFRRRVQAAAY